MAEVVIWDAEGPPPPSGKVTLLWRGFDNGVMPSFVSIPTLVEANAEVFRKRYLAWVYELGETLIKGKRLIDHLELRSGFSYWWMTAFVEKCNYSKSPHVDDAIRLMAFDDWAANRVVARVVLATANRQLAECMKLWCAKSDVLFEWQCTYKQPVQLSWVRRAYHSFPLSLQAVAGLLCYLVERLPLRGVGLKEWQQSDGRVAFISYLFNLDADAAKGGRYESRYWAHLPDDLRNEGCKTNWLHLYVKDALLSSAGKAAGTIRDFNKTGRGEQTHVTLDAFLSVRVVFRALRDWWRLAWVSRHLQQTISATASEGLDLWPLFADDWRQSTNGFSGVSNVLNLNLFESAMRLLPKQRVGVYLQENQGWEFGLIHAWNAAGQGRLVGCPHSSVRFWDLRYFFDQRSYRRATINPLPLPDQVVLNGPAATETYLAGGYPAEGLAQGEALRYLYLDEIEARAVPDSLASKGCLRLLVLGDYLLSNTQLQMRLLEQAAQSLPAMIITVKPHPACPIKPEDYPSLDVLVTTAPISKLLYDCDVAYTSAVTSAAVDAYCACVPVVSVLDPNTLNLSPLRGYAGVFFVSTPQELVRVLISATFSGHLTERKQAFFTLGAALPHWRKLLLEVG